MSKETESLEEIRESLAFLIRDCGLKVEDIARVTGISGRTIYRHMPQELKNQKEKWTGKEIEIFKATYPSLPRQEILSLLPLRSWMAMRDKAHKIHLKRGRLKPYPKSIPQENRKIIAWSIAWEGEMGIRGNSQHRPVVALTNTDMGLLRKFLNLVGYGKLCPKKLKEKNRNPIFCWKITSLREIERFLEEISPFLPAKKEQARLILKFCKSRIRKGLEEKINATFSAHELEIVDIVRKLNKRGLRCEES